MHQFLQQFFTAFPQLASRDFYIAGESYGGSWVPALGARIIERQSTPPLQVEDEMTLSYSQYINLRGVSIGNGLIRQSVQNPGGFEAFCTAADSPLTRMQCEEWADRALECESALVVCEDDGFTTLACITAQQRCSQMSGVLIGSMERNPYDWRMQCDDPSYCYREIAAVQAYMNIARVKVALGATASMPFRDQSSDIYEKWEESGDLWMTSHQWVNYLLQQRIRVLIYAGDKDINCHAPGMRRLVNRGLTWYGHPFFAPVPLSAWHAGGRLAGFGKAYGPLSYAEVADAGHLAPYDKPYEVLTLINAWIAGSLPN
ncbi:hypothetical protein LTR85_012172 [Meristemomyces frigidus]|nr:hypothetical protein LTR85_012172 [Meristemomyces frigidus]